MYSDTETQIDSLCRQEFWSIRQYSGFYKHSVETALFGAEKMFMDMGYSAVPGQYLYPPFIFPRVYFYVFFSVRGTPP